MAIGRQVRSSSTKMTNQASKLGLVNICLAMGVAILLIAETILTNTQVAIGSQSNALLSQQSQLADQVSQLTKEVSRYKSLQYINQQATQELKMEPLHKNLMYLPSPEVEK